LVTIRQSNHTGKTIDVLVKGDSLRSVNALSFALPYNTADYEFLV
jgi:radical SAM superfamily enzyme with C-terminal helix-hairpin-helix motif